jgi:hypothetical protein
VKASAASIPVGAPLSVTVSGTNPCGAAYINYGDGTAITYAITGVPTTQTHVYSRPGAYAIAARGMGNCDGEVATKVTVTDEIPPPAPPPPAPPPVPPAAEITGVTFAPQPGVVRQPVAIAVAGRGTCSFTVNFGDGNKQDLSGSLPRKIAHTYAVPRTYVVTVAPVRPCVGKFTDKLQIAPRTGERITGLTLDPTSTPAGNDVAIVVNGYGTCTYRLDYGDGNNEDRAQPLPDRLTHVYNAPGTYVVAAEGTGSCQGRVQRNLEVLRAIH